MKLAAVLCVTTLLCSSAACATMHKLDAPIINNQGVAIGTASITEATSGVIIRVDVAGLPEGRHGIHFLMKGACAATEAFKPAEGHIMPDNAPHGFLHEQGTHAGNLPKLIVGNDGSAHVELYSQLVSLKDGGDLPALQDADGSALIIHANEDDHITQPIGGSGDRVACAAINAD